MIKSGQYLWKNFLAITLVVLSGIPIALHAQCTATITPQAVPGTATRGKVGFPCGSCPTNYYLSSNDGTGDKTDQVIDWTTANPYEVLPYYFNLGLVETMKLVMVSGSRTEYNPDQNPDGSDNSSINYDICGASVLATHTTSYYHLFSYNAQSIDPSSVLSCTTVTKDGVTSSTCVPYCNWSYCSDSSPSYESLLTEGFLKTGNPANHYSWAESWAVETNETAYGGIVYNINGTTTIISTTNCQMSGTVTTSTGTCRGYLNEETYTCSGTHHVGSWYDDEYTTGMLIQKVQGLAQGRIPSFPTDEPVQSKTPTASTELTTDNQDCASATVCKWRAKVRGTIIGKKYSISYTIVETKIIGGVTNTSRIPLDPPDIITATEETWWYPQGGSQILKAPNVPTGNCLKASDTISLEEFKIHEAIPMTVGNGEVDDNPNLGSGCSTCSGNGTPNNGGYAGLEVHIGMGAALGGGSAGEFQLTTPFPSTNLATPAALAFSGANDPDNGIEIVQLFYYDQWVWQVVTPQGFAVITTNSPYSYQIAFYLLAAKGTWDSGSGGYHIVNGLANRITTWTITNPDGPTNFNRLQITDIPTNGPTRTWLYTYDTNRVWNLVFPGNLGSQQTSQSTDQTTTDSMETVQFSAPNGTLVWKRSKVYHQYDWGEGLISDTLGTNASVRSTLYTYYTNATEAGYSPSANSPSLKQVVRPDGTWEYYSSYDTNGRPLVVLSGIDTGPTNNASVCRSTEYTYTPVDSADDGTIQPRIARKVVEKFKGTVIGLTYRIFSPAQEKEIRCISPTATYTDSANLVTITTNYADGTLDGRVRSIQHPDGTMDIYEYSLSDGLTTTIYSGQPNTGKTAIVDGTETVIVTGSVGEMISRTVTDILSGGIILEQDTYDDYDEFKRPQRVTHLDGTTEQTIYACCGVDYTVDRNGATTQYSYDLLKRQVASTRFGITTTNILDVVGNVIKTIRIGSDNSQIVQRIAAYDAAGQMNSVTNALNGGIAYSRTNDSATGSKIETVINPDGGTITNFYYADGSLKKFIGTAVHGKAYRNGTGTDINGNACFYTVETNLNTDGSLSSEWTKTFTDMAGRTTEILYADNHYSQSYYNSIGQLSKQVDPDVVTTLYQYNGKGELAYTVADTNRNGTIDYTGNDRITWTTNDVTTDHSMNVRRTRTYVWDVLGSNSSDPVSTVETSTDGLNIWQTTYRDAGIPVTTYIQILPGTTRVVTIIAPDGSYTINTNSYGRPVSSTRYDSSDVQIGSTSYSYDAHGRQGSAIDARNGKTLFGYNNADLIKSVTTPNPGTGGTLETTTTFYNSMLQATNVVQPDGTSIINLYLLTGELGQTYGSRTYPVAYSYDYAGRITTMTNWSNFATSTGSRVTTWTYDANRGFLTGKTYADGHGPSYTYTPAGRLATRTWVRGVTTTYGYDYAGGLSTVVYSDSTPGVTNTYDRLGRQSTVICNGMTDSLAYNLANELLSESYSGGILNGLSVTNGYDQYLRRTNLTALGSIIFNRAAYAYDAASRLSTVSDGTNNANYSYIANSPLVSQIIFKSNSVTRMTTTKTYDFLNRLQTISSLPSSASSISDAYTYNAVNQRMHNTLADGSYWVYQYDSLGQVTSGKRYWSDGTPVAGQQFEYANDDIGNRTSTKAGGDQNGANLRSASYANNTLNQITSRDVPGYVDVMGVSFATNTTVAANGQTACRKGEYFRDQLPAGNSSVALWTNINVTATSQTSVSGNVFVAKSPEVFGYDADGNMTNDGRFYYYWDAENRLINLTSLTNAPTGSKMKLDFDYDSKGRRIQKIVSTNTGSSYVAQSTNRFLYDGWNLIVEVIPNNSLIRSYIWGTDLSGAMQGAGGVGGLLEIGYYGSSTTNGFITYDGNGNVTALVNTADGTTLANYEYGPFGEILRATGPMAKANLFRFSTKYQDDDSDLLYYGYRYYKPSTGTWPNRDPLGDASFFNSYSQDKDEDTVKQMALGAIGPIYCFNANTPIAETDLLGLENASIVVTTIIRPPAGKDGVKTKHGVVVSDHGDLVSTFNFVGTTTTGFGTIVDTGVASFGQGAGGNYPDVTVFMEASAHSAFLPSLLSIYYGFEIDLNFCSRKGHLSGSNNRFPSYNVIVDGKQIYDFQQQLFFPGLLGQDPAEPNVDFRF